MTGGVLDGLVEGARERARRLADDLPFPPPKSKAPSFREAIRGRDALSVIAEFKRKSPSAGALGAPKPGQQARAYRDAGAAAISVLTDPAGFGGSLADLTEAFRASGLPVLMKDFVVAPAQIRAGWSAGASAVLLIARCLDDGQLRALYDEAIACGLDPLIEVHGAGELDRVMGLEEAVIGVNNRDLDTLRTDRRRALELLPGVPEDRVAIAESGYLDPSHLAEVRGLADGVLVGTALMRAADPSRFLAAATGC